MSRPLASSDWRRRAPNASVVRCAGALRVPELDPVAGINEAEAWMGKRVFGSFQDSSARHIAKLAGILAPVAPGFVVSLDALDDCGVRPTASDGPPCMRPATWSFPAMTNLRRSLSRRIIFERLAVL
ncbi:hypothetical protein MDOR_04570 [Mycolicibacterium doricum]|uniref:Uncharacterized protein n=1 Tax=Mycolicibacterium doricum TaxID=126673 RepID=A0A7I7VS13_9MYCO|nr:hypothetical protein MDOR_04570 [Mycolicibacterium doricum]